MLDQTQPEASEEILPPETEVVEGADAVAAEEPREVVIAIEGEEPEVDEDAEAEVELGEKGLNALRRAREAAKESARKLREAEAKLAAAQPAKPEPVLKRPSLEDCGFNEDVFAQKMADYVTAQREIDAKRADEEAQAKARETAYREKLSNYHAERAKVGVDDDLQAKVVSALNEQQQTALMDASGDPAKVVAALARTPKVLAELAGIKEIHKFTYRLAQIEGRITMTTKAPPPPESKLKAGVAGGDALSTIPLEKLHAKAQDSGDWSAYLAEKRRRSGAAA